MPDRAVDVLLLTTRRPGQTSLETTRQLFGAEGITYRVIAYKPLPARYDVADRDSVHALSPAAEGYGPAFRRAVGDADPSEDLRLHVESDPEVQRLAATARAILVLDDDAVRAARSLAGAGVKVVRSRNQAVKAVAGSPDRPTPDAPRTPLAHRVAVRLPVWAVLALLRAPFVKPSPRRTFARMVATRRTAAGQHRSADRVIRAVAAQQSSARERADLLGTLVSAQLFNGVQAALARDAYAAELEVADEHLAAGRTHDVVQSVAEAARTAFHRVLHHDGLTSPLAASPADFLAPWHASTAASTLSAPRGRARAAATPPTDRPLRLLISTWDNGSFLTEIRAAFEARSDVEVRYVEFAGHPELAGVLRNVSDVAQYVLQPDPEVTTILEQELRPHLDWADVAFVDWCTGLAARLTAVDPGDTRIIVRLHSFEAFARWPHIIDFSRVDDLVLVSDIVRDVMGEIAPALERPGAARTEVLTNAVELVGLDRPKPDEARFVVGLIGWWQTAKDPLWTVEVVKLLREHDPRYRLLILGKPYLEAGSESTQAYARELEAELTLLGDAVDRPGHTDDIPGALTGIGTIISSSVRESFHVGLVEGAASGAVPVVRDWPYFAGRRHSARTLFPEDWVVDTPREAADRILRLTADDETWRSAGREAAEIAVQRWDWAQVRPTYERLVLGDR
jgi:glycosyltransferase involved in cell wall biosynthesis